MIEKIKEASQVASSTRTNQIKDNKDSTCLYLRLSYDPTKTMSIINTIIIYKFYKIDIDKGECESCSRSDNASKGATCVLVMCSEFS